MKRLNCCFMLVMTASKDQAEPHWKRTFGGLPFLFFLSFRLSSISISSQMASVYVARTSVPSL